MAIDILVKPLLSLSIFRDLTPLQLTEIVRRSERIIYRPGDVIVAEDNPGDAAIIVVSGSCVQLNDSGDHTKRANGEILPEGTMIAELAMLVEIAHSATVIAQSPVKALRLTRDRMLELMQEDPALADHFFSQIVARLKLLASDVKSVDPGADDTTIPPQRTHSVPADAGAGALV